MEENQQGEQQEMEQAIQPIVEMGSSTIRTGRGTVHVLTIVGAGGGEEEVDGLLVLLNTVGGDIEAGLGIAELIASMSKPTVSPGAGGRPLHRSAPGRVRQAVLHRPIRRHDYPSGAAEWAGDRRAPDLFIILSASRSVSCNL